MPLVLGQSGAAVSVATSPYQNIRETLSLVQRQIDDFAWVNLSTENVGETVDERREDRDATIRRARLAARRNPLAIQAIHLLQHYTLGQGVSIKASNKKIVGRVVDEFWTDPVNEMVLTSHQAMKELLAAVFTDGDYFLVLFPDKDAGTMQLGYLDALLVQDVVMDPENSKVPKWYKVKKPITTFDFKNGQYDVQPADQFMYYRHWRNEDPPPKGLKEKDIPKGLIYQVSADRRGKFGQSQLATALDWLMAHKEFMQDRASLNKAAASVAWRKKRKGGASDISAEVTRLQSSLVLNNSRYESNPPPASASTIVENEGTQLDWVKTDTGGAAADADERKLRMMAGQGLGGIPNHYFGDEANANLATATAMELPLLKTYEDWQQTVRDILADITTFYLSVCHEAGRIGPRDDAARYSDRVTTPQAVIAQPDQAKEQARAAQAVTVNEALTLPFGNPLPQPGGVRMVPRPEGPQEQEAELTPGEIKTKPVDWYVDVDFPPIIQKAIDAYMNALKILGEMLPGENVESKKLLVEMALPVFGQNDIDQIMERIFPADMVAVLEPGQAAQPALPPGVTPEMMALLTGMASSEPKQVGPGAEAPVVEAIADYRRRRVLRAVRDVADAYAVIGGN